MDRYYANLTRDSLQEAEGNLLKAQDYLRQAHCPQWVLDNLQRKIGGVRNLIDQVGHMTQGEEE